jgi:hypothetical protein
MTIDKARHVVTEMTNAYLGGSNAIDFSIDDMLKANRMVKKDNKRLIGDVARKREPIPSMEDRMICAIYATISAKPSQESVCAVHGKAMFVQDSSRCTMTDQIIPSFLLKEAAQP